ncbi:MAG: DUF4145 domain-containing protein [Methanoregula sp.]|nr:DUF4145 domain-containing protein [Methanoregula sp.]
MKCPHCLTGYHPKLHSIHLYPDCEGAKRIDQTICSECGKSSIFLQLGTHTTAGGQLVDSLVEKTLLVYPKGSMRPPCPIEVPDDFSEDYKEACLVLGDSPKASAALSRRCLQHILREKANVTPSELSKEIQEILDRKVLPSHLSEHLDAVRNIGNFAAHPNKSKITGEITSVEPGEAEWCLDVVEGLFDYYFVQPAITAKKRAALDKKLADAGKPPMK